MNIRWLVALTITGLLTFATTASAAVPVLIGRVNDYANLLSPQQEQALETRLARFEELPGKPQVVVLTTTDMGGEEIEEYSVRVAREWGIGQKDADNGILITIFPAKGDDFRGRIEVGYGLEGIVTDVASYVVYETRMRPHFQPEGSENYYAAFSEAADALELLLRGEIENDPRLVQAIAAEVESRRLSSILAWCFGIGCLVGGVLGFVQWWVSLIPGAIAGIVAASLLDIGFGGYIVLPLIGAVLALIAHGLFLAKASDSGGGGSGSFGGGSGGFRGGGGSFGGGGFSGGR